MASWIFLHFLIASFWRLCVVGDFTSYNSATHLCCNGTVVAKASKHIECCGAASFDSRHFVCCDSRSLHPLPVGHNGTTYDCCLSDGGAALLYDYTTHQCCDGSVLSKPVPEVLYSCCQRALYNPQTQHCCGGRVMTYSDDHDEDCCDATVYSQRNQQCCEQWSAIDGKLVRSSVAIFSHQGGATECCGTAGLHDPAISICCQGAVQPLPASAASGESVDCCQGAPYDLELETCCEAFAVVDGRWVQSHRIQKVADGLCCGLEVYDFRSEVCCGETVHAKPEGAHGALCCGERLLADSGTEACLHGMVVPRNGSDVSLCDGKPYYTDLSECCNGQVVALESEMEECCWDAKRTYRKDKEMCCGAEVVTVDDLDRASGNDSCCTPEIH